MNWVDQLPAEIRNRPMPDQGQYGYAWCYAPVNAMELEAILAKQKLEVFQHPLYRQNQSLESILEGLAGEPCNRSLKTTV